MKRILVDGEVVAVISGILICFVLIVLPIALNLTGHSSLSFSVSNSMYGPNSWGPTALRLY